MTRPSGSLPLSGAIEQSRLRDCAGHDTGAREQQARHAEPAASPRSDAKTVRGHQSVCLKSIEAHYQVLMPPKGRCKPEVDTDRFEVLSWHIGGAPADSDFPGFSTSVQPADTRSSRWRLPFACPVRLPRPSWLALASSVWALPCRPCRSWMQPVRLMRQFAPGGRAPLSFADIVERVKPAVVSIHVTAGNREPKVAQNQAPGQKGAPGSPTPRRGAPEGGFSIPGLPDDHPLNELFKNLPRGPQGGTPGLPSLAQGSGFIISEDGYVVTNNHVVENGDKIQVTFDDQGKARRRTDRHRSAHRHRAAEDQDPERNVPGRQVRQQGPARRRLGARGRQSVRLRRHGDGRHRLGAGRVTSVRAR